MISAGPKIVPTADFEWWVAPNDYELRELHDGPVIGPRSSLVRYSPDPKDAIHRDFAALSDAPEGYVEFAGLFGLPRTIQEPQPLGEFRVMRDRINAVVGAIDRVNGATTSEEREKARSQAARLWAVNGPVNMNSELRHVSTLRGCLKMA